MVIRRGVIRLHRDAPGGANDQTVIRQIGRDGSRETYNLCAAFLKAGTVNCPGYGDGQRSNRVFTDDALAQYASIGDSVTLKKLGIHRAKRLSSHVILAVSRQLSIIIKTSPPAAGHDQQTSRILVPLCFCVAGKTQHGSMETIQ